MTSNPHPVTREAWIDRVDLDDIFRDAKPIGDGGEWTVPGFFEGDHEHAAFLAWLQADRTTSIA